MIYKISALVLLTLSTSAMGQQKKSTLSRAEKGGNGGEECALAFKQAFDAMWVSYAKQVNDGTDRFGEFNSEVLRWMITNSTANIVPVTTIGGAETDARNFPDLRLIELSRPRWCKLPFERKVSILFHEYLGLMGLEETNEYTISSRLKVRGENGFQWSCSVPHYRASCMAGGCWGDYMNPSNVKGEATNDSDAFDASLTSDLTNWKPCFRVQAVSTGRTLSYDNHTLYQLVCVEAATPANSCVKVN